MFNIRIEKGKQKIMNNYKKNDARITMELQWQNSGEVLDIALKMMLLQEAGLPW
jgi:hypothetical protein